MALTKCRECGAQVSNAAKACPSCGISNPGLSQANVLGCLLMLVIGVLFVSCVGNMGRTSDPSDYSPPSPPAVSPQADTSAEINRLIAGTGRDWVAASPTLRGATSREMAARFGASRGWSNDRQLNVAAFLVGCINGATDGGGISDQMQVSELAATCMVLQESGVQ